MTVVIATTAALGDDAIPKVEDDYRIMSGGERSGSLVTDIIPINKIRRIVLLKDQLNSHFMKPRFTADEAIKLLFEEGQPAKNFCWLAEEQVVAQFLIVDTSGDVYIVEALRHLAGLNQVATAFTLHGKKFGCRFELRNSKFQAR